MLRTVQARGVNIVTVEDPVEYRLQGIVQVQVNEKAGLTFPAALRSILRQDPDVILVGEIRDKETANIAIQASLTGHLVLSTLHTNDAASSVTRLIDIGIESYKIAAALKGVVAQRLMRRLCSHCRELSVGQVPDRIKRWFPDQGTLYRGVGCTECSMTGYRGRLAVEEVRGRQRPEGRREPQHRRAVSGRLRQRQPRRQVGHIEQEREIHHGQGAARPLDAHQSRARSEN